MEDVRTIGSDSFALKLISKARGSPAGSTVPLSGWTGMIHLITVTVRHSRISAMNRSVHTVTQLVWNAKWKELTWITEMLDRLWLVINALVECAGMHKILLLVIDATIMKFSSYVHVDPKKKNDNTKLTEQNLTWTCYMVSFRIWRSS